MTGKMKLYIVLLVLGVLLLGSGLWLRYALTPEIPSHSGSSIITNYQLSSGIQVNERFLYSYPALEDDRFYAISPDGRRIAWVAKKGSQEVMVVNGVESKPYLAREGNNFNLVENIKDQC